MKNHGYIKVACVTPKLHIADPIWNMEHIHTLIQHMDADVRLAVFPELCISGYTCQDLFYETALLTACQSALLSFCEKNESEVLLVLGLPLAQDSRLYNCAVFVYQHRILGVVPKTYLPNYNEYYEQRWFSSSRKVQETTIRIGEMEVPFTSHLLIEDQTTQACIAAEICEDGWVAQAPSIAHALHGANLIVNLSASNETIGKSEYRKMMIKAHSAKCICGYVYASAGVNESTSDLVFSGHDLIVDNGYLVNESAILEEEHLLYGEIDIEKCQNDRRRFATYLKNDHHISYERIRIQTKPVAELSLTRSISPYPFVPADTDARRQRCHQILQMQAAGLAQRLRSIACQHVVIGISGGLDSTLALLVAVEAFARCKLDTKGIIAVTMPGFGTSDRTYTNSAKLMEALHTTALEISIKDACLQHYQDIQHDPSILDITYENTQARERTQILMDIANKYHGIVIGTGDLSELALGWCTYNGDHMSMYAVNASVPKTLVRYVVESYAMEAKEANHMQIAEVLEDICATPVSPELLPPKANGEIAQITEDTIGSYDLHDFFLYHMLRNHYAPAKIYALACLAFKEVKPAIIKDTMTTFYRRFFTQQFKRNCFPDGVKIGSICLSPRGDWRMPSDATVRLWLSEAEAL